MQRRDKRESGPRTSRKPRTSEPLEVGREVRDLRENKTGVIVESACQYAHPKANPVYNYLVRWQDGQVQAINEAALAREFGLEVLD